MKKSLLFILLLAAVVSYGVFNINSSEKVSGGEVESTAKVDKWAAKSARIDGYVNWRTEQTKNVYTGQVDPSDYYNAIRYANDLKTQSSKTGGVLGLEWVSRGPDSQAGRSRTILFDRTDPNLVYTGGISGGLYKSTDLARNWERVAGYIGNNASVMSLAQTVSGTIFVGTGESLSGNPPNGLMFNASLTGDGIYKSNDDGATWTQIDVTNEFNFPTASGEWSSVRAMATHPTKSNLLLVGNNNGVRISIDAEDAQPTFFNASGVPSNVSDVQITSDGKEAWAAAGGRVYRSTDELGNFATFSQATPSASGPSRAQIALSTVDASGNFIVYTSITNSAGCLVGVYKSEDKGATWTQLAFAGGSDPFAQPSGDGLSGCQGWYDHCIAVNPVDKDKIYIGGITFYTWGAGSGGLKRADQIDSEGVGSLEPNYIHADKHAIRLSPHDPSGNTMLIAGDGGINRCLNANSGFPDNMIYTENNKSLITLQCYSVGSGKYGEVAAGAQDNGSQYVDYTGISPRAAKEYSGGDGVGGAEISNLSPDILFSGYVYGVLYRSLNNGESSTSFLDETIDPAGCGHITCSELTVTTTCEQKEQEGQSFIFPFYLMETHDRLNPKNDLFVYARNEKIPLPSGDTLTIKDTIPAGVITDLSLVRSEKIPGLDLENLGLDYTLPATLFPGDTFFFENKFDAKYFVPSSCSAGNKFFVCSNPLEEGVSPRFTAVNIPLQSGITRMDASSDGDMLAAVSGSRVIIMQGWDSFDPDNNPNSVTNLNVNLLGVGASSLSGVWVNKNNKDHVLVTEHGYGSTSKVFVSFNATSTSPTFANIHNNLPEMPIYSCVIDAANPDRYILGTELGIWATNDGGVTWSEENDGMGGRYPIYSLRQNWMNNFDCNVIAAGSFGAGMYTTTTLMDCAEKSSLIWGRPKDATPIKDVFVEVNHIAVYPNPVQDLAKITFDLNSSSDITVKIVDLTGKIVSQKKFNSLSAGSQTLEYNVSNLASSSYLVVVSAANMKFNSRMIIKK